MARNKEYRTCVVADTGYRAPAGWSNGNGYAYGTQNTRATCVHCREPVCVVCSVLCIYEGKRNQRICANCLDEFLR